MIAIKISHLIIPNLHRSIICSTENIRLVSGRIIVDAVDSTFMSFQSVMRSVRSQSPHLDGTIQTGTGEGVRIFGIEFDLHDIMGVALKHLCAIKATIPIPQFDGHIITTR